MQYEYKCLTGNEPELQGVSDTPGLIAFMNKLGEQEWELVTITHTGGAVFKRELARPILTEIRVDPGDRI